MYHVENMPPKEEGICDRDGAKLVQRPDDKPEVVARRLDTYHQQTEPLVNYYRKQDIVHDIDASKSPEEVNSVVIGKLDALTGV